MTTKTESYFYFWRDASPFSQWHQSFFVVDGIEFNCAEQWMMYQKALLFKDEITAAEILKAKHPKQQKSLGRKVYPFIPAVWEKNSEQIVYDGNYHKFSQNLYLLEALKKTEGMTLVEASPFDKIWGIGLNEEDARSTSPEQWPGQNKLGKVLTKLRIDMFGA